MTRIGKIALYGLLMWVVPFAVSCVIFPWELSYSKLFDSVMPVVVALTAVLLAVSYFRSPAGVFLREGIIIGVVWLAMSLVFNLLMFVVGPMKMPLADYVVGTGIPCLIIPAITIGLGYIAEMSRQSK